MQYLLLARHGNTFAPGQKVVWVGSQNDLPLVESGIAQAHDLAHALKENSIIPDKIYSGNLKRVSEYAQIICDDLQMEETIDIDNRLNEIDYGKWTGLSEAEIIEKFGRDEIDQWNDQGKWPKSFFGGEADIIDQVISFAEDKVIGQPDKKITLVVTSNGRLKYFLKLIPELYTEYIEKIKWKVGTGKICLLGYENNTWCLIAWNYNPPEIRNLLRQ